MGPYSPTFEWQPPGQGSPCEYNRRESGTDTASSQEATSYWEINGSYEARVLNQLGGIDGHFILESRVSTAKKRAPRSTHNLCAIKLFCMEVGESRFWQVEGIQRTDISEDSNIFHRHKLSTVVISR